MKDGKKSFLVTTHYLKEF